MALSEADKQYIKEHVGKISDIEIAKAIGCSRSAVMYYRHNNRIPSSREYRLTLIQEQFIREHYRVDMTGVEMAKQLDMNINNFYAYIRKLGLANDKKRNKV